MTMNDIYFWQEDKRGWYWGNPDKSVVSKGNRAQGPFPTYADMLEAWGTQLGVGKIGESKRNKNVRNSKLETTP